jgi:hypothetical protein
VMLLLAVPLHLGIAICLGMVTFGLIMLVGNLAFVSPRIVRAVVERGRAGQGGTPASSTASPVGGASSPRRGGKGRA